MDFTIPNNGSGNFVMVTFYKDDASQEFLDKIGVYEEDLLNWFKQAPSAMMLYKIDDKHYHVSLNTYGDDYNAPAEQTD